MLSMGVDWGTVIGLVLGAFTTLGVWKVQARDERRFQSEDFERQQSAIRAQEVRARADIKAQEALEALQDLERLLVSKFRMTAYLWPKDADDRRAAKAALQRLSEAALYIPLPLRVHLELAVRVLEDADELGSNRWLEDSPWMIGRVTLRRSRGDIGRYLRGEGVTAELSSKEEEYDEALGHLEEYRDLQVERQIAEEAAQVAAQADEASKTQDGPEI